MLLVVVRLRRQDVSRSLCRLCVLFWKDMPLTSMVLVVVRWRRQQVSTSLRRLCVMFWKDASDLDAFGGCAVATTACEYKSAQVVCDVLERCL